MGYSTLAFICNSGNRSLLAASLMMQAEQRDQNHQSYWRNVGVVRFRISYRLKGEWKA
jgi:hypothetical protein